jgi:phosphoribosylglycinamide formyltransferase-1
MINIGWFSSGRDEAAIDLLKVVSEAIQSGIIKGKISFVLLLYLTETLSQN